MYVCVCVGVHAPVCMCPVYILEACDYQNRVSDSVELELQVVVNHDAGNQTPMQEQGFLTAEPSLCLP